MMSPLFIRNISFSSPFLSQFHHFEGIEYEICRNGGKGGFLEENDLKKNRFVLFQILN